MRLRHSPWIGVGFAVAGIAAAMASAPLAAGPRGRPPVAASDEAAGLRLAGDAPQRRWIRVEPALPQTRRLVAVLPAQVALDEDHTVRVASPVAGRVTSLDAKPGDRVEAGQALLHLNSSDMGQAASDLVKADAAEGQAASALARARDLYEHKVIALKDLQQAETDEATARAERDRARGRVQALGGARAVDPTFVLRAPIAGEVLERSANPGAEVRPDDPVPRFVISETRRVWITASLYPRDLALVHPGDMLRFTTDAAPGRTWEARVTFVSHELDPQTRTATLRAGCANPGGLLRAMTPGEARVFAAASGREPSVPTAALVTRGDGAAVVVERPDGRFVLRPVRVGDDDGETCTIVDGLRAGERVVTQGSLLLAGEIEKDGR